MLLHSPHPSTKQFHVQALVSVDRFTCISSKSIPYVVKIDLVVSPTAASISTTNLIQAEGVFYNDQGNYRNKVRHRKMVN
jgi:hypothetical protein